TGYRASSSASTWSAASSSASSCWWRDWSPSYLVDGLEDQALVYRAPRKARRTRRCTKETERQKMDVGASMISRGKIHHGQSRPDLVSRTSCLLCGSWCPSSFRGARYALDYSSKKNKEKEMIHVIATVELHPGTRDKFLAEFRKLVPEVK